MKIRLIVTIILFPFLGYSQDYEIPKSFEHLKKITIDENWSIYAFLPQNSNVSFVENNDASLGLDGDIEIGFVKIGTNQKSDILIKFSYGMSDDPSYEFYSKNTEKLTYLFSIYGQQIFIPGNGFIYVSGIVNNSFDKKIKYKFMDDIIKEVNQPLYYVGLKTKTKKQIKLYSEKDQTTLIATLPNNSLIEVVASEFTEENQFYLIKSSFGLLGWWKLDNWFSQEIENLFFHGD